MKYSLFVLFLFMNFSSAENVFSAEVQVPKKIYSPLFRDTGEKDTSVGPFMVDETPVTNREFLEFLKKNEQFRKSKITVLYSDSNYLSRWSGDLTFPKGEDNFPATEVSWFAARKYCKALGKRLPTIAEWEVASDAQNPAVEAKILEWYGKAGSHLRNVGKKPPNKFGVKDSSDLVWEWVDNFSETILFGDSRGSSPTDSLFCGGASLNAKDPKLYATFIRFAFRSSLTAKYTSGNLGFRCVKDMKDGSK